MQPSQNFLHSIAAALAADTTWLAEATPFVSLHLAQNDFNPNLQMTLADLTECTFTGYAAINAASAATQTFYDPTTLEDVIQVREPAGGWHFACSGTPSPAQQVTGWYLTDSGATKLIGCQRFEETILITSVLQAVDVDQVRFQLSNLALS